MTRTEFVEMLNIMSRRSMTGNVIGARCEDDVGSDDAGAWASLVENIHGRLYLDDSDEEPVREGGTLSTKLYALDEIGSWPKGLFDKLVGYTWWIDPGDEINILDVLAAETGIKE